MKKKIFFNVLKIKTIKDLKYSRKYRKLRGINFCLIYYNKKKRKN